MSRKKIEIEADIIDYEFPNKGLAICDGVGIKIKNTIPGEKVLVTLKGRKKEGILKEVIQKANYEHTPECIVFGVCGGCTFQHIEYKKEIALKVNGIRKLLKSGGIDENLFEGCIECPSIYEYRNKMEFSFGDTEKGGSLALGMRKRNSFYEVANADGCLIIHSDIRKILVCVRDFFSEKKEPFYHKSSHNGTLRHLIVRRTHYDGEILVNIVTVSSFSVDLEELSDRLFSLNLQGKLKGFIHTLNDSPADAVKIDKCTVIKGEPYITETLLGLKFKISPFSFFQTNSQGAEKLYSLVREFAGDIKDKVIYDLYCGTGTISQIMAKNARKIIGIEIVGEAVSAARDNAALNGIDNCEFIEGDVLEIVDCLSGKPDIIILDPPREGIHPKAAPKIASFGAQDLIYISCKASSMIKDFEVLAKFGYKPKRIKCVDMFARTYHIETVCLLSRKS